MRITQWYTKLAYVVVAGATLGLLGYLFGQSALAESISAILTLAAILAGARVFRGRDEERNPTRAWWRMTSRSSLSEVVGAFSGLGALTSLVVLVVFLFNPSAVVMPAHYTPAREVDGLVIGLIETGAISFLYLNCAVRLWRLEAANKA